ncbi:hypothetical protein HK101_001519 [Irineochytrium annulatum]|nr:hypothetical protein HK101_001519 [Irineochytrium annulatum]
MVPAIDTPAREGWNRELDVAAEKKPDAETEKTVEDLLALAKDGVFPKEAECIYRLPAYRNAWREYVFSLAASGAAPGVIEYLVTTGGLSLMERDSENATILTVAATHKRRELCDYLLGTSDGRALFFDLANSEDTRPEDEAKKLFEEKRRSTGEGSTDAGGEGIAFKPELLPVERLMGMDNFVLLEVFLDNIRRYKWASDRFIFALKPVLDRCLKTVMERKDSSCLNLFAANMSLMKGRTNDGYDIDEITLINEMHARLLSKLDSTIDVMTVVNILQLGQIPSDLWVDDLPFPRELFDRPSDRMKSVLLAMIAVPIARSAEHRGLLKWILDDYGASFEGFQYSVMEAVVLGHRGVKAVEELIQHLTKADDGEVQDRRAFFEEVVVDSWDGDAGTLVDTFKTAYFEAVFGEHFKDRKRSSNGWRSNRKAATHADEGWEERLDTIKMVMEVMDEDASERVPRLNLLTVAGEINILRWLRAENLVDMSTQLYPVQDADKKTAKPRLIASDADGDEDDCAVCFKKKNEPQMMDCKHSFCKACVQNIYDHVDTTPAACPLCRRAFPPLPDATQTPIKVLAADLKRYFPSLTLDASATTVGDALLLIAAWVGNVVVVAYLVDECGVDPSKVCASGGVTAMHVACTHGHVALARWLRSRDASLFDTPTSTRDNDDTATPLDALLTADQPLAFDIVRDFTRRGWLPHSWVERGRSSPNARIARYAEVVGTEMSLLTNENALGNVKTPPPLEVIVGMIKDECLEDLPISFDPFIARLRGGRCSGAV